MSIRRASCDAAAAFGERRHKKARRHSRRRVLLGAQRRLAPFWTRYFPDFYEEALVCVCEPGISAHDFARDLAETGDPEHAGGTGGEIEHPAANERAAVVDGDDDGAAAMAHAQLGAERQRTVGAGHGVLVETLARGGLAAGLITVKRGNTGEA